MRKDSLLYPFRKLHGKWNEYQRARKRYRVPFDKKKRRSGKCVFLVLTPEHTNLGDHAIASAAGQLLNTMQIEYVEIPYNRLVELRANGLLKLMNGCPILINGGGNLGTLWFEVEQLMRDIISNNPRSTIFILPNTVYYEESPWGKEEFERAKALYNTHKKLTIYAREQISFSVLRDSFRNVKLVPDLVMSLNKSVNNAERDGCLLCLRNDYEKTVSANEEAILLEEMRRLFGERVSYTDTHAKQDIPIDKRDKALEKKLDEFRDAELVVTDRLHGMIFCAITGTPCIVINSQSPKVKGCYEWIKHLDYIRFCGDVTEIAQIYESIPKKEHCYDNTQLLHYYQKLCEDILGK